MGEKQQVNKTDTLTRARKTLTPEQERKKKQDRFLAFYRESGNIKHSCKKAGIGRTTFYEWKETDEQFQKELEIAREEANDTLEMAAQERAVKGVMEPVISQGNLVYEYEPVLDADGKQTFDDRGKPVVKRGKQVFKPAYSDTLLALLLKANLPTKYREKQQIDMTTTNTNDQEIQALYVAIDQALAGFPDAKIALADALVALDKPHDAQ